ncbi:MAG: hypothetical protein M3Y87_17760, partial [Myxococcota bacterium]|nr:hypothetical protein [Myxococcota bacterium]
VNRDTLAGQRDASLGVTVAAFASAALLAGAGTILLVMTEGAAPGDREARVACAPVGPGLACAGRF